MRISHNYNELTLRILNFYNTFETFFYMTFAEYEEQHILQINVYDTAIEEHCCIASIQYHLDEEHDIHSISVNITACSSNDNDYDIIDVLQYDYNTYMYKSVLTNKLYNVLNIF